MTDQASETPAAAVASDSPKITVTIKPSSAEAKYTITISLSITTLELKQKLSTTEYANVPPERQRLIYSGRVLKDPDTLETYRIMDGTTIHLVKSAAPSAPSTASSAAPSSNVPTTFATGSGGDPLANLTGARYAGHVQLPGPGMFGPDGGMGPPPDANQMMEMMDQPGSAEAFNAMMSNPQVVEQMLRHPMLNANPQMRAMLQNPEIRRRLFNPEAIRQAVQMQRMAQSMGMGGMGMGGQGATSFPAPGATNESTPDQARSQPSSGQGLAQPNPGMAAQMQQMQASIRMMQQMMGGSPGTAPTPSNNATQSGQGGNAPAPAANPFAAFFPQMGAGGATGAQDAPFGFPQSGGAAANPFAAFGGTPDDMNAVMQQFGMPQPSAPADSRPPEVRYELQLQQLNDMGFHDFERNISALRRSGGNVHGAVEYLFS